jgi:hypothetical protein
MVGAIANAWEWMGAIQLGTPENAREAAKETAEMGR